MSLTLKSRFCGKVFIIECAGKLMAGHDCLVLESALDEGEQEFANVVLDLSELSRMDSSGLGLLMRHTCRLSKRGGAIRIASPQPFVAHLLEITHLSETLRSYRSEEEAIQSFLLERPVQDPASKCGPSLLVFDPSADLCAFVRGVVSRYGFDVRTVCSLRDAKLLLRIDPVDYILVGPGTPQLAPDVVAKELSAASPKASALQLGPDFHATDAAEATAKLLKMLGVASA